MRRGGTESRDFSLRTSAKQPRYNSNAGRYKSVGLKCDCNRDSKGTASQPDYIRINKNKKAEQEKMGLQNKFPCNRILGYMLRAPRIKGNT